MDYSSRLSRTPTKKSSISDRFFSPIKPNNNGRVSMTPDRNLHRRSSKLTSLNYPENERLNSLKSSFCSPNAQFNQSSPRRRQTSLQTSPVSSPSSNVRHFPSKPIHVVELDNILSDFYISPLDWSRNNTIAFALEDKVLFFNPKTMESHEPRNLPLDVVSLKFNPYGDKLFFGCHEGDGIIYDIFTNSTTYETRLFETTVLSIDWKSNQILTGCSDGSSSIIDMRDEKPIINIQSSHLEEVCSVKFQPDSYLYATCGNDCTVKIWDQRNLDKEPLVTYSEHEAAIRAVSWCPTNKDLIVTGGGTADRCIKMWNVQTGDTIKSINTGSQVCNLFWNSEYDEIFSTHGYSQNHLAIWKGTDLSPVASFHNHRQRILYMCHSPDGTTVATAAPDDSLQIWKMFPSKRASISQSLLLLR